MRSVTVYLFLLKLFNVLNYGNIHHYICFIHIDRCFSNKSVFVFLDMSWHDQNDDLIIWLFLSFVLLSYFQLLQKVSVLWLCASRPQLQAQYWWHLIFRGPFGQHRAACLRLGCLSNDMLRQHLCDLHAILRSLWKQAPCHVHHLFML